MLRDICLHARDAKCRVHRAYGDEHTAITCHRAMAALRRAGAAGLGAGGEAGAAAAREAAWALKCKVGLEAQRLRAEALLQS